MLQALLIEGDKRTSIEWPRERSLWDEGQGVLWLDLQAPSPEAMQELEHELALHPMVVRACLHPEHRARIKDFREHVLLVLNAVGRATPEGGNARERLGRWRTLEVNIVIGKRFLLTVHPEAVPAISALHVRYAKEGEGRSTLEFLLFSLCEEITTGYYVLLDRIDRYIDEAENSVFEGEVSRQVLDKIFALKRHLLYLRRVLGPQRDALGALMRREFYFLSAEGRPYFIDVYEHTLRLLDLLDTYRDLISTSLDAYLSMVNNRMNEIMKMLTMVSTVMLPLGLIASIYGMNFEAMPMIHSAWGFWLTMVGMAILAVLMVYYFRRRKWM